VPRCFALGVGGGEVLLMSAWIALMAILVVAQVALMAMMWVSKVALMATMWVSKAALMAVPAVGGAARCESLLWRRRPSVTRATW
jgi:hypothetical protein